MANAQSGWRRVVLGTPAEALVPEVSEVAAEEEVPRMTTLDPGCEIEGTLTLDRSICIEGEFSGAIRCAETVMVGKDAAVQADIDARSIEIHGAVVGNVKATRELVLYSGARLHGDIDAPSVVIERGAFFRGETRMFRPEQAVRAPAEAQSLEV